MAAWSDHQTTWAKPTHTGFSGTPVPVSKRGFDTLKSFERPACWDFFTDEALIQLLADASSELGRRNVPLKVMAAS